MSDTDSSDLASDKEDDTPGSRGNSSEGEDERSVDIPRVSQAEYSNFKRFALSPSEDEDDEKHESDGEGEDEVVLEEEVDYSADELAKKPLRAALKLLREAFPLVDGAADATGRQDEAGPSSAEDEPEVPDAALKSVLRLEKKGTKAQQAMMKLVDWRAVKNAARTTPAYAEHPKLSKAMVKVRAALVQRPLSETPVTAAPDIFTHRTRIVEAALRKAWELDTAIDLLERQPRPKAPKVEPVKPASPSPASISGDDDSPVVAPLPTTKRKARKSASAETEASDASSEAAPIPRPRKKTRNNITTST